MFPPSIRVHKSRRDWIVGGGVNTLKSTDIPHPIFRHSTVGVMKEINKFGGSCHLPQTLERCHFASCWTLFPTLHALWSGRMSRACPHSRGMGISAVSAPLQPWKHPNCHHLHKGTEFAHELFMRCYVSQKQPRTLSSQKFDAEVAVQAVYHPNHLP